MNILIVAAHPDDEVLGCGAVIKKHTSKKDKVFVCILTDGGSNRYNKKMTTALRKNALSAARVLGVTKVIFEKFPNQMLDTVPIASVIHAIEKVTADIQPEIIYTHDGHDLNRDHVVTYEATLVATRPLPGAKIKKLFTYFVPSSTEYNDFDERGVFIPNVFVNIKNEIDAKIKAFSCYRSEIKPYPHPRSIKALRIYANRCGIQVGMEYAEPFKLIRHIC
jgi:LmbE family N-acetylglucosaminyl deacetylase